MTEVNGEALEPAQKWLVNIQDAQRRQRGWEKTGDGITERYRDEKRKSGKETRYNILYSNTETIRPLLFSQMPEPNVTRRYMDDDDAARASSEIIERAISYLIDNNDYDCPISQAVTDYLLPGRGVVRFKTKPIIDETVTEEDVEPIVIQDEVVDEFGNIIAPQELGFPEGTLVDVETGRGFNRTTEEKLVFEDLELDYVYWKDLVHSEGRNWKKDVWWVAFRSLMNRKDFKDMFGSTMEAKTNFTATYSSVDGITGKKKGDDTEELAIVWEIWDKSKRERIFVAEGLKDTILQKDDDPFGLIDFFPMPEPIFSITTNESLIPVPFFNTYQDQARELDLVTSRINGLIRQLKRRGVYDASMKGMDRIMNAGDNTFIPVEDYSRFAEKGGLQGVVGTMPIDDIIQAVSVLYKERQETLAVIHDIIGLSDIMRGKTDPREVARSQSLKANFGTLRVSTQQDEVRRFVRDIYRIGAEIVAENFDPQTISLMTNMEIDEESFRLLRDQSNFGYRIDVETEATVATDSDREKQRAVELVSAIGDFTAAAPGFVEAYGPDFTKDMFLMVFKQFKTGRRLEQSLEDALTKKQQEIENQEPEPNIDMLKLQNEQQKTQIEAQKAAGENEIELLKVQLKDKELQLKEVELGLKTSIDVEKVELDKAKLAVEARSDTNEIVGF